jgi:hypothetical protein
VTSRGLFISLLLLATPLIEAAEVSPRPEPSPSVLASPAPPESTTAPKPAVATGQSRWPQSIELDHIDTDKKTTTLHFKDAPRPIVLRLFEVKYLGVIRAEDGSLPYLVITGRPCQDCIQDKAVYLIRADGARPAQFVYPGRVIDPKRRDVLLDSRAFFGRCLNGYADVLAIFQKERIDRRRGLQPSLSIAEPTAAMLREQLIERRVPRVEPTLKKVRARQCFEIEGRSRMMLRKPLDLTPRRGGDDESDEDDDKDKNDESEDKPAATPAAP